MEYHLKSDPMKPPGQVGSMGITMKYWHFLWGKQIANSPEEAQAKFKRHIARVLGFARGKSIGGLSTIVSDAARRLAKNDFEVEEIGGPMVSIEM